MIANRGRHALLLTLGLVVALAGPAGAQTSPPPTPETVPAPPPMPATVVEAVPPSPGPIYVWIAGQHAWRPHLKAYVWLPGHYTVPPAPSYDWMPGYWAVASRGGYVWVEGHWRIR
jgi:hypothetical protein